MSTVAIKNHPDGTEAMAALARTLGVAIGTDAPLILEWFDGEPPRWQLRANWEKAPKPLYIDFLRGRTAWKVQHPGAGKHPLAKALGIRHGQRPTVLDATAGLARDAYLIASWGCQVYLCERHPVVAHLLQDGIQRARENAKWREQFGDKLLWLGHSLSEAKTIPFDVIYLDPMYPPPPQRKTAAVKKDMQIMRRLVGHDHDAQTTFELALTMGVRVVVKKPVWAPLWRTPHASIQHGDHRFEIHQPCPCSPSK